MLLVNMMIIQNCHIPFSCSSPEAFKYDSGIEEKMEKDSNCDTNLSTFVFNHVMVFVGLNL